MAMTREPKYEGQSPENPKLTYEKAYRLDTIDSHAGILRRARNDAPVEQGGLPQYSWEVHKEESDGRLTFLDSFSDQEDALWHWENGRLDLDWQGTVKRTWGA